MHKTVQLDRKLIVETLKTPKASKTGLMITPPPIPQIAPAMEAPKLMSQNSMYKYVFMIDPFPSIIYFCEGHGLPKEFRRRQAVHRMMIVPARQIDKHLSLYRQMFRNAIGIGKILLYF